MMTVRSAIACLAIAVVAATAATSEASASPVAPQAKFTWGVVTGTIYLNKRETAYLSLGAGAVGSFAAALPPPANVLVSSAAALLAAYAGKAVIDGKCLKIKIIPATFFLAAAVQPGTYGPKDQKYGRYCR